MPKGGFFDMVEHPSIRDEIDDGGVSGQTDDESIDDEGEYPSTSREEMTQHKKHALILTPSGEGHGAETF